MEVVQIDLRKIQIKITQSLYSSEVIHKCLYWYKGKYEVDFEGVKGYFVLNITDPKSDIDLEFVVKKLKEDLIDFKTREIIHIETRNIRELLIAKAFAHNDELENLPMGDINDPVGFDPLKF